MKARDCNLGLGYEASGKSAIEAVRRLAEAME